MNDLIESDFNFQAILEVGEVLHFYDKDQHYPAWGFGARPIDGPVSHCFNLNGSSDYCEVRRRSLHVPNLLYLNVVNSLISVYFITFY